MKQIFLLSVLFFSIFSFTVRAQEVADSDNIPGVVVGFSADVKNVYIGSPSICKLPDGSYLASHDQFSHGALKPLTFVYFSSNKGLSWKKIAQLDNLQWSSLFYHNGAVFLLGCSKTYGDLVIRKSIDKGLNWTTPTNSKSGLLFPRIGENGYHTAPVSVVIHQNRIWRSVEEARGSNWGENFWSCVISAPIDADLLDASNWTKSNAIQFDRKKWIQGGNPAWLEGNLVVTPNNSLVNILRVSSFPGESDSFDLKGFSKGIPRYELAAMIDVKSPKEVAFNPQTNFIHFPGSQSKFTIRYDSVSGRYWSLVSKITYVHKGRKTDELPHHQRNVLMLTSSEDLKNWKEECIILCYKMGENMTNDSPVGFQYIDWFIENDDLVAVSRTAWNNAHNYHDANFMTFHRIKKFRNLKMEDSSPDLFYSKRKALESISNKYSSVPGIVINHEPASNKIYLGSPSICVLKDGRYIVSNDYFGPESKENINAKTKIFESRDKGKSWTLISEINQFWSGLFTIGDTIYLMGTDNQYGNCVIRRSLDGGYTWTQPVSNQTGLIRNKTFEKGYHTSAVPVVIHQGRIWRAFEIARRDGRWGKFEAVVLSAPIGSDLLDASSWKESARMSVDPKWSKNYNTWLEGNIVIAPNEELLNILRVNKLNGNEELAATIHISNDGESLSFNPTKDIIKFPGGCKKFVIRYDTTSKMYWALTNWVLDEYKGRNVERVRNTLALISSVDLKNWNICSVILHDNDVDKSGFQYADWQIEGDDLLIVCRTAFFDGIENAKSQHDSNFITFHRVRNFRNRTMKDNLLN